MQLEHTETLQLDYELPEYPEIDPRYRRAPRRESHLSRADQALAIKNALRYIHPDHHAQMAKEFAQELAEHAVSMATASVPQARSMESRSTNTRAAALRAARSRS